jgi:long-chain acyl-CoA synthetase
MNKPHRLFDCIDVQLQKGGVEGALVAKEAGQWRRYSTREIKDTVDKLSAGLLAMGISSGDMSVEGRDKIAIISKNRPEWVFVDLAVQQIGAVLVPIYPTAHVNDMQFIMNDAAVKLVFFNDGELVQKVREVVPQVPTVKEIFSFEKMDGVRHWPICCQWVHRRILKALKKRPRRLTPKTSLPSSIHRVPPVHPKVSCSRTTMC